MKALALDPAARCGWAWGDGKTIQSGVWGLSERSDQHPGQRLFRLRELLRQAHDEVGFDVLAAEDASFGSRNPKTQASHNELRGIISLVAAECQVPLLLFHPTTIKKFATGDGRADKSQMVRACKTHFGIEATDDNEADAIFVLLLAQQTARAGRVVPATAGPKRRKAMPVGEVQRNFFKGRR